MNRQETEKTITEYLKPIFGFALKRCRSMQDAEDLSQEIALKAFRALLSRDDVADMGKFIWTIAHNTLSNYYRAAAKSMVGVSLEEAVELVLFAFENAHSGDILVKKAPACTVGVLAQAVRELFQADNPIRVIGIRHGEKMYETLLTNEECAHAVDMGDFYRVPSDSRDLNYDKYFVEGNEERNVLTEFNSNNTRLLTVDEVKEKLLTLSYIQEELAKWNNA